MTDTNIIIRPLNERDWRLFRAIRLAALKSDERMYGVRYVDAVSEPMDYWTGPLTRPLWHVLGAFESGRMVGLTTVIPILDDPDGPAAEFCMSYVQPGYRGRGIASRLYAAGMEYVLSERKFERAIVHHREGNEASRGAILGAGFEYESRSVVRWPDGTTDYNWRYSLDLAALRGRGDPWRSAS